MAADNQSIKDAFALSGNRPAVTNDHLARLLTVMEGDDADAFWDETYDYWKEKLLHFEDSRAADIAQGTRPTEL